jgi:D-beta-D-heptose 7-phosphate kinase/D-beta-D-heptose 1-phosphate adenosyltransferase
MALTKERLEELLGVMGKQRILVVGDLMLDEFLWGKVSRISPEAPVPVVEVTQDTMYPGGAANVARNLCALGLKPTVAGVIGRDEAGEKLTSLLKKDGARIEGVLKLNDRPTTRKTRVVARQQQIVRVDMETKAAIPAAFLQGLISYVEKMTAVHDAIIIEDYGKGVVDQSLVTAIVAAAKKADKIVAVDPNPHNPLNWKGVTVVKPNRSEAFLTLGWPVREGLPEVQKAASQLQKRWDIPYLLITLGEEGMILLEKDSRPYHIPTRAREVYDVSGAGDSVIAVYTTALAAGATGKEAAELANHAAGVVVGKLGTATATMDEIRESFLAEKD